MSGGQIAERHSGADGDGPRWGSEVIHTTPAEQAVVPPNNGSFSTRDDVEAFELRGERLANPAAPDPAINTSQVMRSALTAPSPC